MEPVILFITITAILSGTYIRSKKINLERERMRMMGGLPPVEEKPAKKGLMGTIQQQLPSNNAASKAEMDEIKKRLENLEVIAIDSMEQATMNNTFVQMQEEIKRLQDKVKEMEWSKQQAT